MQKTATQPCRCEWINCDEASINILIAFLRVLYGNVVL